MNKAKKIQKYERRRQKKIRRHNLRRKLILFTLKLCLVTTVYVGALLAWKLYRSINSNNSSNYDCEGNDEGWCLILVNQWNSLPHDYQVELITLDNGELIDQRIYSPLQAMFDEARENDIYLHVVSGYRTFETQQALLDEKIEAYKMEGYSDDLAVLNATAWVAIPNTSEHQLGIAVDINADISLSSSDDVYEWLASNAHRYGFINRYPSDKTDITGVINEPWHYRFVGVIAATQIHNQGLCLEEYLEKTS